MDMSNVNDSRSAPASLFLSIDDFDNVANAVIEDTSKETTRKYISRELEKVKGYGTIPDETIVEYRFPDRKSIPPFNPGFMNEYYSRDLYCALDGRSISRQYMSLRVAAFLVKHNADPVQSEDVYRRVLQCSEYREFAYLNNNGLLSKNQERLDADDMSKLVAIRTEGGPALADILPVLEQKCGNARSRVIGSAVNGNEGTSLNKVSRTSANRKRPVILAKPHCYQKRNKGFSL
jgi:hypothetical protein